MASTAQYFALTILVAFLNTGYGNEAPAVNQCDFLAAHPSDPGSAIAGVGMNDIKTDEALAACKSAVEQYSSELRFTYQLGRVYHGMKEHKEAIKWYRKAAEQGHAPAQFNLGVSYKLGNGIDKDVVESVKWYRKAAEQGDATAQFNLGVSYQLGNGVEKDVVESVKWYRKAAEQGIAPAQFNLGYSYEFGYVVEKNAIESVKWYHKAAEQGYTPAQYNLGRSYGSGNGVEKDVVESVKWYRKAAEQGHAKAQINLGFSYERGNGVEKDVVESVKWYRKAAEQGYAPAIQEAKVATVVGRWSCDTTNPNGSTTQSQYSFYADGGFKLNSGGILLSGHYSHNGTAIGMTVTHISSVGSTNLQSNGTILELNRDRLRLKTVSPAGMIRVSECAID